MPSAAVDARARSSRVASTWWRAIQLFHGTKYVERCDAVVVHDDRFGPVPQPRRPCPTGWPSGRRARRRAGRRPRTRGTAGSPPPCPGRASRCRSGTRSPSATRRSRSVRVCSPTASRRWSMGTNRWMPLIAPTSATTACTVPVAGRNHGPGSPRCGEHRPPGLGVKGPARQEIPHHGVQRRRPMRPGRSPAGPRSHPGPPPGGPRRPGRPSRPDRPGPRSPTGSHSPGSTRAGVRRWSTTSANVIPTWPRPTSTVASAAQTTTPLGSTPSTVAPASAKADTRASSPSSPTEVGRSARPRPTRGRHPPTPTRPTTGRSSDAAWSPSGSMTISSSSTRADRNRTASRIGHPEFSQGFRRQGQCLLDRAIGVLGDVLGHDLDHVAQHPFAGLGAPTPLPEVGGQTAPSGGAPMACPEARSGVARRRRSPIAPSPGAAVGRTPRAGRARRPAGRPVDRLVRPTSSGHPGVLSRHRHLPHAHRRSLPPATRAAPSAAAPAGPGPPRPRGTRCSGR